MNKIFSELYDLLFPQRLRVFNLNPRRVEEFNLKDSESESLPLSEFRKLYADIFPVIKPIIQKKIQNIFMFHYILCINNNFENKINIVINFDPKTLTCSYDVISKFCIQVNSSKIVNKKSYSIDETKNSCRIPNSVIKDWWAEPYDLHSSARCANPRRVEEFNSIVLNHLMSLKTIQESLDKNWGIFCLKNKISEIILSGDSSFTAWINSISNRLMNLSS